MQRDCEILAAEALLFLLKILNNQYSRGPIKTDGSYQPLVHPYGYTD